MLIARIGVFWYLWGDSLVLAPKKLMRWPVEMQDSTWSTSGIYLSL